ncbi:MAG TPA: LanC-like protein [Solirubrobacteraceae bacterium]|nr:LanC-like protein [Solirubrobacteraceae bacterium]
MLWRASEHEPVTEEAWTAGWAQEVIQELVADAETAASSDGQWPFHPRDDAEDGEVWSGLYLGAAGMAWALWKLDSAFDGASAVTNALERYRASPDFMQDPHPPSLLCGETGILVAAERVGSPAADPQRLRELIRANRSHPTRELMWGSPGTMLAARAFGFEQEWHESAELLWAQWDEETDLWTQHLYGHAVQLMGPAHGFAGNVSAMRGLVGEEVLRERVARLMERMALRDEGLVNWPPEPEHPPEKIRVQWCHGAPGIIATVGDLLPWELALAGGELTWRAGPLRKGPGLCHGTAGNGFAFLRLHALTGDRMWLDRARRFAVHAVMQVRRERATVGHGRYSLFTGDIGVALYLRACLDEDPAFPLIDTM